MGWLELLPLLKRALPLLTRLVPMLETFVAARVASRGEAENTLQQLMAELKVHQDSNAEGSAHLQQLIARQAEALDAVTGEVAALRRAGEARDVQAATVEQQLQSIAKLLRLLAVATVVLLLACISLLAVLIARHA